MPVLEAGRQIELVHPAAPRALEGAGQIELANRETKQVDTERHTSAADAVPTSTQQRRRLAAAPGNTPIREQRHFQRHGTIHALRRTEGAKQRKAELDISHEHSASHQPIELRTAPTGV